MISTDMFNPGTLHFSYKYDRLALEYFVSYHFYCFNHLILTRGKIHIYFSPKFRYRIALRLTQ